MLIGNVLPSTVKELAKLRLNLNHLWLLERLYHNTGTPEDDETTLQALERKLLCVNGKITEGGKLLYDSIINPSSITIPGSDKSTIRVKLKSIKDSTNEAFEELWKNFPANDTFTYKGIEFIGGRALRKGKEECRVKFASLIAKGEYSSSEVINALKVEVAHKKEVSFRTGQNKLSYMNALPVWLNQEVFVSFIGSKEIAEEEKSQQKINTKDMF